MARTVIPPPQGQVLLPDVPNWTWHEYGMRVGFWRLKRMYERLGIAPTVTLNARVCETYPPVVQACVDSGWELNAHSYEQSWAHFGTPDEVRSGLQAHLDATGHQRVMLVMALPGLATDLALRSMRLFVEEVAPALTSVAQSA